MAAVAVVVVVVVVAAVAAVAVAAVVIMLSPLVSTSARLDDKPQALISQLPS